MGLPRYVSLKHFADFWDIFQPRISTRSTPRTSLGYSALQDRSVIRATFPFAILHAASVRRIQSDHHCDGLWFQRRDITISVLLYRLSLERSLYGSKKESSHWGSYFQARSGNDSLRPHTRVALGGYFPYNTQAAYCVTGRENGNCLCISFASLLSTRSFSCIIAPPTYIQRSISGGARRFTHALARQTRTHGIAAVAALARTGKHFCFNDDTYVRIGGSSQRRNACWYPLSTLLSDLSSFGNAWQRSASVAVQEVQNGCDAWDCATASRHPAHCGALVPPIRNQRLLPAPVVIMLNDQCVGCMTRIDQHAAASESVPRAFSRRRSCELRKSGQD
jgi:hypothetical protein